MEDLARLSLKRLSVSRGGAENENPSPNVILRRDYPDEESKTLRRLYRLNLKPASKLNINGLSVRTDLG